MYRSHVIRLIPNDKAQTHFAQACGCSRLAYNWGLAQWTAQYRAGGKPSAYDLKKQFNSIKREQFPFVYNVTKSACERAFTNLGVAFERFFKKLSKYPKFRKKGIRDAFYIAGQSVKIDGRRLWVPKLGWVRMAERLRFLGKVLSVTISRKVGKWFVAVVVELPDSACSDNQVRAAVGVDVGINSLMVLSDGTTIPNTRVTKRYERALRRLNRSLSRKVKRSRNWQKTKARLAKIHYRIRCVRQDHLHKATAKITGAYSDICMEDLNVKGMVRNKCLAKALSDAAFGEVRRQLAYKAKRIHFVNRFFASTRLCMNCGQLHDMSLSERIFVCDCVVGPVDRDLHAAQNILRQGLSEVTPVEMEALASSSTVGETTIVEAGNTQKGCRKDNPYNFL